MEQSSTLSKQQKILEDPLVLSLILKFAGQRQWLLAGSVNSTWAAMHEELASQSKQTSYAQVVTSLARVQFASSCDPTLVQEDRHLLALSKAAAFGGSNNDVLSWAQAEAGPRWSGWLDGLRMTAAAGRQLAAFQRLRMPLPNLFVFGGTERMLAERAATAPDLETLQWLFQVGLSDYQWSHYDVATVAASTAAVAAIEVLDWLSLQTVFPAASWDGNDVYSSVADASIKAGAVPSLRWLVAQGLEFDDAY
jgi:hypothetical protein